MKNLRIITLVSIILSVAIYRVLPHPFNFTPVLAMALFSGVKINDVKLSLLLPLLAMLLSDLVLGLHQTMIFVYAALGLIVGLGHYLNKINDSRKMPFRISNIFVASVLSSGLFFIVTNFGVWLTSGMYSTNLEGLLECYIAAVPFLQNSVIGTLVFSGVFFGGFYLAEQQFSQLKESHS